MMSLTLFIFDLLKQVELLFGQCCLADQIIQTAELKMCFRVIRIDRHGALQHFAGLEIVAGLQINRSQISQCSGVPRSISDRLLEKANSMPGVPLSFVRE